MDKQKREELSERIIDGAFSLLKFHSLIIFFMVLAITPILLISELRKETSPLPIIAFGIWVFVFYKLSSSLHDREIVSYWVSLPCAALVIIASLFY